MTEVDRQIFCDDCGEELPQAWVSEMDARQPCAKCGSVKRRIEATAQKEMKFYEKLDAKLKSGDRSLPNKKRLRKHIVTGDEIRHSHGDWVDKTRVIDRDENLYTEKVVVKETGEVIRDVNEPLTDHQGHGSAKNKK